MDNYITDRTIDDVDRVRHLRGIAWQNMTDEEREEWYSPMKGAYNHTDLNRVELAVSRISTELKMSVVVKTNWAENDVPTTDQMQRYLDNVYAIRTKCPIPSVYPMPTRTMAGFDYEKANDIETTLLRCEQTVNAVPRSGELYMGEL